MSYKQTESDKADEKLLRRLLTEEMPLQDATDIITHVFSNLIRWTHDDAVIHLTQVFNFTDEEADQLLSKHNIVCNSAPDLIMNPSLTPSDYDHQDDFQDALVQRMHLAEKFIEINKYIDEHLDFAKHYTPPQRK